MKNRIQDSGFRIQAGQVVAQVSLFAQNPKSQIPSPKSSKGFTLVEMIVVIVISGIIAGMVAMFIRAPVQGYVDSARRAEMSDIADTALRRMGRDLRTAVPNSVRVAGCGGIPCVEFIPTRDGGRYRVNDAGGTLCAGGDDLNFGVVDTCFDIIGPDITFVAGDWIVVGSTQSSGNPPYCTATTCVVAGVTEPGVLRAYTGAAGAQTTVAMSGAAAFPTMAEVQGSRFQVVSDDQQAVTYACVAPGGAACAIGADGNGTCELIRYWSYGFNPTQVAPTGLASPASAVLAQRVSFCSFTYDINNTRNSLLAARLMITSGNPTGAPESVNLYHEVHINNIP